MTESQWLESDQPDAMLTHLMFVASHDKIWNFLPVNLVRDKPLISDRKARLFAVACCRDIWHLLKDQRSRNAVEAAEMFSDGLISEDILKGIWQDALQIQHAEERKRTLPDEERHAAKMAVDSCSEFAFSAARNIAQGYKKTMTVLRRRQAELLRMIVVNPFRPISSLVSRCSTKSNLNPEGEDIVWKPSWLTPTVLSIAQQAYNERPARKCKVCHGDGYDGFLADEDEYACSGCGRPAGVYEHYSERSKTMECPKCSTCHGTGTIEDGRLDQDVLNVLADALIDAGMPEIVEGDCPSCTPHRDDPENPFGAGKRGYHPERSPASGRHEGGWTNCKTCRDGLVKLPNPILTALRSPEPKYRGFWVLDVLLGKE